MRNRCCRAFGGLAAFAGAVLLCAPASADPFGFFEPNGRYSNSYPSPAFEPAVPPQAGEQPKASIPANLRRQVVSYPRAEALGTIVIDTAHTYLYYVLGGGKAIRYGIGVGRQGFTWSGVETIARKAEWPDWMPPEEMLRRQPYLPRVMAGGPGNPLGARALYLGNTEYRIHGTNAPETIGKHVSSGCIRMLNDDVIDLYQRAQVGTKVVVLPNTQHVPAAQIARTHVSPPPYPVAAPVTNGVGPRGIY